jgi:predicted MFS family arabinose efflux permease
MNPRLSLLALSFGNFAIGTGVLVLPGMLTELAAGLAVSVPLAGQLIAASAALICVGAPVAAAFSSRIDRRRLLVGSLVWYAAGLALSALAQGYAQLMIVRVLSVVSAAIFTPQAAATAALLVPPEKRAGAIAATFLGWSIASVLGMPAGSWIAGLFGWRSAFAAAAALAMSAAVAVQATLPSGLRVAPLSAASWLNVARHPQLRLVLAVTVLSASGQFLVFAYIAPYLQWLLQADTTVRALLLVWVGAFGVIGNTFAIRGIDALGTHRAVHFSLLVMAIGIALLPAGYAALGLTAAALALWGIGIFATNSAQQARLASIAPPLTSASIALNTSAIYIGQAIGSAGGGLWIAGIGIASLTWAAAAIVALALALSLVAGPVPAHQEKGPVV